MSSSQISPPDQPTVTISEGGRLCQLRIPDPAAARPQHRGDRAAISGFSDASRRLLSRHLASIDQSKIKPHRTFLTTLTYPAEYPTARATKRHLDNFIKRMTREWGRFPIVWKLEPQKRGAPHYHLLLFLDRDIDPWALTVWTANNWHEASESEDLNHLKWHMGALGNQPCCQQIATWQGITSYAAKYLGKKTDTGDEWTHPGRYWGIRHKELLPVRNIEHTTDHEKAAKLKRHLRRYYEHTHSGRWKAERREGVPGVLARNHRPQRHVLRGYFTRPQQTQLIALGYTLTPYRRKMPAQGFKALRGCTVFIADQDARRLCRLVGIAGVG